MTKQTQIIKIGISSCLLGNAVRYDGQHKYSAHIIDGFDQNIDFIPFCPEVGIGMSIPRPPIQLVLLNGKICVRDKQTNKLDYTRQLTLFTDQQAAIIKTLSGFILQERSPSCGLGSVNVHNLHSEIIHTQGSGQFAYILHKAFPSLPLIEADKLSTSQARDNFMQQIHHYIHMPSSSIET